eukprot:3776602-Amphidinium_carterae.2
MPYMRSFKSSLRRAAVDSFVVSALDSALKVHLPALVSAACREMEEKQCHIAGWADLMPDPASETLESLFVEAKALGEELWKDELPVNLETLWANAEGEEKEVEPPRVGTMILNIRRMFVSCVLATIGGEGGCLYAVGILAPAQGRVAPSLFYLWCGG